MRKLLDVEIVMLAWWVLWTGFLTYLLFHGKRVSDDHKLGSPHRWFGDAATPAATEAAEGCLWVPLDFEGCAIALGLFVLVILLGLFLTILRRRERDFILPRNHSCKDVVLADLQLRLLHFGGC